MSMRGGIQAGLWVAGIISFCFSVRLSGSRPDVAEPVLHAEDSRWHLELRLACQPNEPPDPTLHRPHPREEVESGPIPLQTRDETKRLAAWP